MVEKRMVEMENNYSVLLLETYYFWKINGENTERRDNDANEIEIAKVKPHFSVSKCTRS